MKTVIFGDKDKRDTLHIEVPGCIVNIDTGLHDAEGNTITRISIRADQYVDEEWHLPDFEDLQYIGIRVKEGKPHTERVLAEEGQGDE